MWDMDGPTYRCGSNYKYTSSLIMGTWKLSRAPCSQFFLGTETHLAASIIKLDFLMCSNFLLHLAKPSRCQSQSLSDDRPYSQILFGRLPLTACTSTQHQVLGCIRLIPCPTWISSSWPRAAEWWRLAEHHGPARILTRAADAQSDTGSPHPTGMGPRLAIWCL